MDASQKILSDLTVYMKYAKFVPELNRRETWEELVTRNMNMHIKKYPQLGGEILQVYKYVYDKKVLPSAKPPISTRKGASRESRERGGRVASFIQVASSTVFQRGGDSADAQWPVRPQRQRCSPDASRDLHIPPR